MGKWDSPSSSGGDKDSDKPPVPKATNLPAPASYERPGGQASREATRGHDGSRANAEATRPKDEPHEQGNRGREGTAAGQGDSRGNGTVSQALFDAQTQILTTHKERADGYRAEVTVLRERTGTLEDRLVDSSLTIGSLRTEVDQLRAKLAKKNDHPAESQPAPGTEPDNRRPPGAPEQPGTHDRPRAPGVTGDSGGQSRVPGATGDPPANPRPVQAAASNENNSPGKEGGGKTGGADSGGGDRGGDGPDGPKPPDATHDGADSPTRQKGADSSAERIRQLEAEAAEHNAERRELTGVIAGQAKTIGRLESEVEDLKAKLSEADTGKRGKDQPAGGHSEAGSSPDDIARQDQDQRQGEKETPWLLRKMPSKEAANVISKTGAVVGLLAVTAGVNGTVEKAIAGAGALGLTILEYKRQKDKKKGEGNG